MCVTQVPQEHFGIKQEMVSEQLTLVAYQSIVVGDWHFVILERRLYRVGLSYQEPGFTGSDTFGLFCLYLGLGRIRCKEETIGGQDVGKQVYACLV